ncbi:GNAT family N-acetyltransferase [Dyadobacter jejuensis]|nr:GNAT family N-acetyltransferase [Dyadobacter jejuensis]
MILTSKKPRQWISVASLPFGSVNGPVNCPAPALDFLLTTIETWLQSNAQQSLLIKTPSPIYATPSAMDLILKKRRYTLYERKINLHIQLDHRPFVDRISIMEKRRLLKARKAEISSRPLEPRPTPADTYDWLEVHRQMRGYTLSINKKEFCEMLLLFPEHYILFGTELHGKLLALAVAVRVSPSVLFTFLLADDPAYRHFSPQILLYEAAYSYCQNMGIPYLDFGLSLDSTGAYKPSLALFKRRIGGVETFKNDWFKAFDSTSEVI